LEEAQKQDEAQLRKKSRPVNRQRKVAKKPIQQELVAAEAEVEAEAQAEAEAEAEAEEQDKEDVQEVEVQVPSQKVSKKPKKQVVQKKAIQQTTSEKEIICSWINLNCPSKSLVFFINGSQNHWSGLYVTLLILVIHLTTSLEPHNIVT
jgi:hypothetical protein